MLYDWYLIACFKNCHKVTLCLNIIQLPLLIEGMFHKNVSSKIFVVVIPKDGLVRQRQVKDTFLRNTPPTVLFKMVSLIDPGKIYISLFSKGMQLLLKQ